MNFYETLGVSETASQEEIRKAYKAKAFQYHPDRNPDNPSAEAEFKNVNTANETLSNPEKRALYDQQLHGPPPGSQRPFVNPADMFNDLFGGGFPGMNFNFNVRQQVNFPRYKAAITLSLAETLQPQERIVRVNTRKPCSACKGTAVEGGKPARCSHCAGNGCVNCGNTGRQYTPCIKCKGKGIEEVPVEIKVNIPVGMTSNMQLQTNSPEGILLSTITVIFPENVRMKAGGRLVMDTYIPYHVAVLGGVHPVELFDGSKINVKFPPIQNNKQMIKIKSKGLFAGPEALERDDLYLEPRVDIPQNITDEHKTILEQLATLYTREVTPPNNVEAEQQQ